MRVTLKEEEMCFLAVECNELDRKYAPSGWSHMPKRGTGYISNKCECECILRCYPFQCRATVLHAYLKVHNGDYQ